MSLKAKKHTSTVNITRLSTQAAKFKKSILVDNTSIDTTSSFILRTASLPLKFELVLAFWKTKDNIDFFSDINQVNASRSSSQLLNTNNILRNIGIIVNYISCFKAS